MNPLHVNLKVFEVIYDQEDNEEIIVRFVESCQAIHRREIGHVERGAESMGFDVHDIIEPLAVLKSEIGHSSAGKIRGVVLTNVGTDERPELITQNVLDRITCRACTLGGASGQIALLGIQHVTDASFNRLIPSSFEDRFSHIFARSTMLNYENRSSVSRRDCWAGLLLAETL